MSAGPSEPMGAARAVPRPGQTGVVHTAPGSLHIAFFSPPVRTLRGDIAGFFKEQPE